jgi:membrane protease YdiL (CAAX protease family)
VNRVSAALSLCIVAAIVGLVVAAAMRIAGLEARELDRAGPSVVLAAGATPTLLEVDLQQGDEVTFEACSPDAMLAERWTNAVTLSIDAGAERENVVTVPLDPGVIAGARRGDHGACLEFAGGTFEISDHYTVSARDITPAIAGLEMRARVIARHSLSATDRNFVFATLLLALALVLALALRVPSVVAADEREVGAASAVAIGGVVAFVLAGVALSRFMPPGPTFGLASGLMLSIVEIGIAALFVTGGLGGRVHALSIERPDRLRVAILAFALAPVVGIALRFVAMWVLSLRLTTGEAPIEAFVSWPSGLFSFAMLSVVAPISEEIFFRGFVYGTLLGKGGASRTTLAFLGAWLLFVLAHLWQTWGNWGGFLSIAIAGLGFTLLRATTRSTLVSTTSHLVYNGLLAAAALMAG